MNEQQTLSAQTTELRQKILQLQASIQSHQNSITSLQSITKRINSINGLGKFTRKPKILDLNKYNKMIQTSIQSLNYIPKTNSFNIKQHVQECLKTQQIKTIQNQIHYLKSKLSKLWAKTETHLEKEEPYIYQKIIKRIKNEVQSYSRVKLLQNIRKEIKVRGSWKDSIVDKNVKQSGMDVVKQRMTQNVSLLKQIKERKVLGNDIMFSQINNLKKVREKLNKIPEMVDLLQSNVSKKMRVKEGYEEQQQNYKIYDVRTQSDRIIQRINKEIEQYSSLQMWESNINTKNLQSTYSKLSYRLSLLQNNL